MKVTVASARGEGRTTVATFIAERLREAGFEVEETDEDVAHERTFPALQSQRLSAVASRTRVTVETRQLPRAETADRTRERWERTVREVVREIADDVMRTVDRQPVRTMVEEAARRAFEDAASWWGRKLEVLRGGGG